MTKIININDPVIWEIYDNIKILDIAPDKIEFVKKFSLDLLISGHLIYRNAAVKGPIPQSVYDDTLIVLDKLLQDRTSLIAIDENTNEIIGAIILKVMDTEFHAWTQIIRTAESENLKAIMNITHDMLNFYNETNNGKCVVSLHSFFIFSLPEYCGVMLQTKLLLAAERVAASMKIKYLTTVAFSSNNQKRALRAGMTEEYRIYYALYKDHDGNRPFDIKIKREWYCIFYMKSIEPQIPYTTL